MHNVRSDHGTSKVYREQGQLTTLYRRSQAKTRLVAMKNRKQNTILYIQWWFFDEAEVSNFGDSVRW